MLAFFVSFIVNAQEVLFEQEVAGTGGIVSVVQNAGDFQKARSADDFVVPNGGLINKITVTGFANSVAEFTSLTEGAELYIFADNAGDPDGLPSVADSWLVFLDAGLEDFEIEIEETTISLIFDLSGLEGGGFNALPNTTYWLSVSQVGNIAFSSPGRWNWFQGENNGGLARLNFENGAFGQPSGTWATLPSIGVNFQNLAMKLENVEVESDADCDHDQLWLVGAGITQAGWSWDTPVALPCTGDNVYSGIVEFTPLSDGNDGNFRFFTEEGNWTSGLNFPFFVGEDFSIHQSFENANDDDSNFLFTGMQGEYTLTVDFVNKTILLDGTLSNESFVQVSFDFFVNSSGLNLSASEMISTIEVYNLSGKRVLQNKLNQLNGVVNLDQLSKGMYLARLQVGNTTKTLKFVK